MSYQVSPTTPFCRSGLQLFMGAMLLLLGCAVGWWLHSSFVSERVSVEFAEIRINRLLVAIFWPAMSKRSASNGGAGGIKLRTLLE